MTSGSVETSETADQHPARPEGDPEARSFARGSALRLASTPFAPIAVVIVCFGVAAVRLATRHWVPVLDMAMTELRVRDVGSIHTPLIGLPGRLGSFPDQGSHPGPLSFYLLAPLYRLLGSTGGAMLVSTCLLAAGCGAAAVAVARRSFGIVASWAVALLVLVIVACLGLRVLTQPWNPFFPLMFWVLALVSAWAVVAGHHRMVLVVVAAASVCAQTHISYVLQAGGIGLLALGAVAAAAWFGPVDERRSARWSLLLAIGLGAMLWMPVLVDQLSRSRGNLGYIRRDFASKPEDTIGLRAAASLFARHLDLSRSFFSSGHADVAVGPHQLGGSAWLGLALVGLWLVAVVVAVRARHRRLLALDLVIAAAGVLGWLSASRIYGIVWFYLTMWAYVLGPFLALSIAWSVRGVLSSRLTAGEQASDRSWFTSARVGAADRRRPQPTRRFLATLTVLSVLVSAVLCVQAARLQPPDARLSTSLRAVLAPTARALEDDTGPATGRAGRYVVRWDDAFYFGSQGYGLVNELERRGFDVGVPSPWRVPVTLHRVREVADATAVVQLATGSYIDVWRKRPGAIEVAHADTRTPSEVARFASLRRALRAGLEHTTAADLVPLVDQNLFALVSDPRSPPFAQHLAGQMLELGEPLAVFIVGPKSAGA